VKSIFVEARVLGPVFAKFWEDKRTGVSLATVVKMLRKIRIPQATEARAHAPSHMFSDFAEQQSHDYNDLVQLVLAKVNDAVGFLRPLWTFPSRYAPREIRNELWDASLFGPLPE
jgi:hypothetical protein